MSVNVNEQLIRSVVEEVVRRLGPSAGLQGATGGGVGAGGAGGVFADVDSAVGAAAAAQKKLHDGGMAARAKVGEVIRGLCRSHAEEWGRLELAETQIGRLDHKIAKLQVVADRTPGVEWLKTAAYSGDAGITLEEAAPWGVVGIITPVTHSIPTLANNAIMITAAGNSLVCNPHPSGAKCAAVAVRAFNAAIEREVGIANLICLVSPPTIESAGALMSHRGVSMLLVTGGPALARAALSQQKRAVVAGPGNPPVVVDATADLDVAARKIIEGASFDNNLLCIGEKECFVVAEAFDGLCASLERHGAVRLTNTQVAQLTELAIHRDAQSGHYLADKKFIGKDASVLAAAVGVHVPADCPLLFGQTMAEHPFVVCEQMMPFLPVVRCDSFEQAVDYAVHYEHGFRHTAIIHSKDVGHMTYMGQRVDTTLFVKNGSSMNGLGLGGEGYVSFSIATPTGEGATTPMTFTRYRRCTMVENLRIV